ncbi:MAG TPA: hypothetical protein VMM37_09940 [Bacteroidota bacterium]|nr:hypothetical protein [Bacteroidota bacterium]
MKPDWRFLRLVALLYGGLCIAGYIALRLFASTGVLQAATGAAAMSLVNVLLGYVSVEWSYRKPNITFLKIVLGGIGARLFLMLVLVLVMIRSLGFDAFALTISLLVFYVINLGLEIYLLEHKVTMKNQL